MMKNSPEKILRTHIPDIGSKLLERVPYNWYDWALDASVGDTPLTSIEFYLDLEEAFALDAVDD